MAAYYNDIDAYCCKVLRKNIQQGHLPEGTVDERDIKQLTAADFMGYQHVHLFCGIGGFPLGLQRASFPQSIRVLTGGFPCQDISNAGQRAGITGERSGLWKEMCRLIQEAIDCGYRFDYILIENVAALTGRGLSTVLTDLAARGYDAEWFCLRAVDIGAPHERERIFVVAYPCRSRRKKRHIATLTGDARYTARRIDQDGIQRQFEPLLGRVINGLSSWMDRSLWPARPDQEQHQWELPRVIAEKSEYRTNRIKALGNAIVPQNIEVIARAILENREQAG